MMELTMFERLLQLPLFQGLTTQEVSDVMSHVRLNFVNYHAGDEVVLQGDTCRNLIYIITGELKAEYHDEKGRFTLYEHLPNMKVLEPFNMFGMYQKFSRTYLFDTDGITLSIEKPVMLRQLLVNDIIKINLLNIICNRYQQTQQLLCHDAGTSVARKIVRFIESYAILAKGKKELKMKMTELADLIQETRINVSIALNSMQEKELIVLRRGIITVNDLQELHRAYQ